MGLCKNRDFLVELENYLELDDMHMCIYDGSEKSIPEDRVGHLGIFMKKGRKEGWIIYDHEELEKPAYELLNKTIDRILEECPDWCP